MSEMKRVAIAIALTVGASPVMAQTRPNPDTSEWYTSAGIIGTLVLITIVILIGIVILAAKLSNLLSAVKKKQEPITCACACLIQRKLPPLTD